MNLEQCVKHLLASAEAIIAMLKDVSHEQARWKPNAESWSILEVINHLADEEREDFRTRLDLTLHQPAQEWPSIDPVGWVTARGYNQRSLSESISRFQMERQTSLQWLRSLTPPDWQTEHRHPRFGAIRAGDLLAAWVAHDLLHIRQLNELRYAYLVADVALYNADYAGEW